MYDRLYSSIPLFEDEQGVAISVDFRGTHPELNAHLAALEEPPYDLVSTHTKYAPSQKRFLAPLTDIYTKDFVPAILNLAQIDGLLYGIRETLISGYCTIGQT